MTEMFGEAWPPMSVQDLAPDDDDDDRRRFQSIWEDLVAVGIHESDQIREIESEYEHFIK